MTSEDYNKFNAIVTNIESATDNLIIEINNLPCFCIKGGKFQRVCQRCDDIHILEEKKRGYREALGGSKND